MLKIFQIQLVIFSIITIGVMLVYSFWNNPQRYQTLPFEILYYLIVAFPVLGIIAGILVKKFNVYFYLLPLVVLIPSTILSILFITRIVNISIIDRNRDIITNKAYLMTKLLREKEYDSLNQMRVKDFINTKEDFKKVLDETIIETTKLSESSKEISIYNDILQELFFIKKVILEEKRKPTEEEIEAIMIGAIAVKNLENDMPEYARKLVELDYYFEFYGEL